MQFYHKRDNMEHSVVILIFVFMVVQNVLYFFNKYEIKKLGNEIKELKDKLEKGANNEQ